MFAFHQDVITPNGPGLVQGRSPEADKLLVSHSPADVPAAMRPAKPGLWVLAWYPPDQIKPLIKIRTGKDGTHDR